MTIAYDPADFNELTVLLRWRGTILPAVLCKPILWLLLGAHVGFFYMHMYHAEIHVPKMDWKLIGVPTSLLTFFLVFYSGNCFSRYYALYGRCTGMSGCVMAFSGLLRVHFPMADPDTLYNLCRHAVASVYLLYFQLSGGGSDGGKMVTDSEWAVLLQTNLLHDDEVKRLKAYKGFRPFLLQIWCLRCLQDHLIKDPDKSPSANLKPFQDLMLQLCGHCSEVVNSMSQPIPFPYYHTLTLMLSLNLLLMAYALTQFETAMTFPCYFVICLVCLGLKETAVALADPFGGDDVDFETELYMSNCLANMKAQISADFPNVYLPLTTGHKALQASKAK